MKKQLFNYRFYLGGTTSLINYRNTFNCYEFNSNIKIVDPMIEVEPKYINKPELYSELVQSDLSLLYTCYGIIVKMNKITAGTLAELIAAYNMKNFTMLISEDEKIINDPWIKHFVKKHFYTSEQCIKYIQKKYSDDEDKL